VLKAISKAIDGRRQIRVMWVVTGVTEGRRRQIRVMRVVRRASRWHKGFEADIGHHNGEEKGRWDFVSASGRHNRTIEVYTTLFFVL